GAEMKLEPGLHAPYVVPTRRGFTIVELVVMLAIIGTLIGLLLPAVQQAREAVRRSQCKNQLKQLALAMHAYHDTYRMLPYGFSDHEALWTAPILPFLEMQALFDTLTFADLGPGSWNSIGPNRDACGTL